MNHKETKQLSNTNPTKNWMWRQLRREGRQFLFGTAIIAATMRLLLYVTHYDQQSGFPYCIRYYKVFDKKKCPDVSRTLSPL
jgi:hypothetical protein